MAENKKYTKTQELTYELRVKDVMNRTVVAVSPKTTINELREIFRDNRISGTPVEDKGKLIGIISIEDVINCLSEGEMDAIVADKMSTNVEVLRPDEPLVHAVSKFNKSGFGRFPVIERDGGKLAGVITKGDIIKGILEKLEIHYHEEEIQRHRASYIFDDIVADQTTLSFQYNIKSKDFNRAGESSSQLKKALNCLGIQPDLVRRSAIAAYEAEMNIVVFADGGRLSAAVQTSQIKLTASDSGPGIPDIEKAMQPGYSTAPDWVQELGFGAGMGLMNIKNCTDKMDIQSEIGKGTHITAIIYLNNKK
ncbi:CBS domain-containing protein [candidate division KSB1 bacterium]|nr:CBS domain-containing protein [candidate division KSB1 bacterium]